MFCFKTLSVSNSVELVRQSVASPGNFPRVCALDVCGSEDVSFLNVCVCLFAVCRALRDAALLLLALIFCRVRRPAFDLALKRNPVVEPRLQLPRQPAPVGRGYFYIFTQWRSLRSTAAFMSHLGDAATQQNRPDREPPRSLARPPASRPREKQQQSLSITFH